MKKITSIILCVVLTFTLTACGKPTDSLERTSSEESSALSVSESVSSADENSVIVSEGDSVSGSDVSEQSGELTLLAKDNCSTPFFRTFCSTDDGAYILTRSSKNNDKELYGAYLTYVDFASKQEVYVCSDSACKHDNEHCTAFFDEKEFFCDDFGCRIFVFDDKLYLLSAPVDQDDDTYEGMREPEYGADDFLKRSSAIYRMNKDGSEREKIYQADDGENIENFAAGEGDKYLWFITKTPTAEKDEKTGAFYLHSKNRALIKFDIEKKNIVERIPLDDIGNIVPLFEGIAGGKFIFSGTSYADGGTKMDGYEKHEIGVLGDPFTSSEWERIENSETVYFALDRSNREIKETFRVKYSEESSQRNQGDFLYRVFNDNSGYKVNLSTGERIELENAASELEPNILESPLFNGSEDPPRLLLTTKDKALVYKETGGEANPYGGVLNAVPQLSLISLEDLRNGTANYEEIQSTGVLS